MHCRDKPRNGPPGQLSLELRAAIVNRARRVLTEDRARLCSPRRRNLSAVRRAAALIRARSRNGWASAFVLAQRCFNFRCRAAVGARGRRRWAANPRAVLPLAERHGGVGKNWASVKCAREEPAVCYFPLESPLSGNRWAPDSYRATDKGRRVIRYEVDWRIVGASFGVPQADGLL